ncbi:hypothetical protein RCO28_38035 [Streptomyces sp. LHD-70]|uniref:DinB/UmuC family translesion DNA polymerase n=1 Tax=Streptomyces sp. LHD-70 TaxID=3072140 RepID=UPI00280DFA15|nr:hypothetical protein [Streptomyces sp. LHD-70]MDQ8708218.1 hypothetical protein [Streptomyces sp. LHD-70]
MLFGRPAFRRKGPWIFRLDRVRVLVRVGCGEVLHRGSLAHPEQVRATAARLAASLGTRLRFEQLAAGSVTVMVRLADGETLSRTRTRAGTSGHTDDLRAAAYVVLDSFALQRARIRRVTLVAERIVDAAQLYTQLAFDPSRTSWLRVER